MNKPSSSPAHENPMPESNPGRGEAAHRQKRPRAPQLGAGRKGQRDVDARRPKSARHHGDADGLPNSPTTKKEP